MAGPPAGKRAPGKHAFAEAQPRLGPSLAITLRIYSHWFKAQDSGAVGKLSALILGSKEVGKK
jgi:hypothetical protein